MAEEAKIDEREGQELSPALPVLPVEYQLFILWVQSERKLMGREEDSGNPEGDGGLERKVSSLAWDCF